MTILYCDCFSGISGDMFLGALIDAGLPAGYLAEQYRRIALPEFHDVTAAKVHKGAIAATLVHLDFDAPEESHSHAHDEHEHEHEHEHAHEEEPGHEHSHEHEHEHEHSHAHDEHEHEHHHEHEHEHEHSHEHGHEHEHEHEHAHSHNRNLGDIRGLIENSSLSARVQQTSLSIFQKLAEAEAKVHGSTVEEVHFHEVGAVDSILDIVGAAVGLEFFDVETVYASALPLGTGQVMTQHGLLPLPAPATLELLRAAQAPVQPSKATKELVTPTGAAILAALATFRQPNLRLKQVGIGAGQRDLEWPNILRILLGEPDEMDDESTHLEMESNIDDMNPQIFGQVMARLFQAGALDVYFTPIYMKKNRPATKLSVIARRQDEKALCDLILRETSTLGIRVRPVWRREAAREMRSLETRFGPVPVKLKTIDGQICQWTPEFDACVRLAEQAGVPVAQVLEEAAAVGHQAFRA
jgi:uncharacterized protein (TIGR00299 family) protein